MQPFQFCQPNRRKPLQIYHSGAFIAEVGKWMRKYNWNWRRVGSSEGAERWMIHLWWQPKATTSNPTKKQAVLTFVKRPNGGLLWWMLFLDASITKVDLVFFVFMLLLETTGGFYLSSFVALLSFCPSVIDLFSFFFFSFSSLLHILPFPFKCLWSRYFEVFVRLRFMAQFLPRFWLCPNFAVVKRNRNRLRHQVLEYR